MLKPWLTLGLLPNGEKVILAESETLEIANMTIGIVHKKFLKQVNIIWVVSRKQYEKSNQT